MHEPEAEEMEQEFLHFLADLGEAEQILAEMLLENLETLEVISPASLDALAEERRSVLRGARDYLRGTREGMLCVLPIERRRAWEHRLGLDLR